MPGPSSARSVRARRRRSRSCARRASRWRRIRPSWARAWPRYWPRVPSGSRLPREPTRRGGHSPPAGGGGSGRQAGVRRPPQPGGSSPHDRGAAGGAAIGGRAAAHGDGQAHGRRAERRAPPGEDDRELRGGLQQHRRRGGQGTRHRRLQHARRAHRCHRRCCHDAHSHDRPADRRGRATPAHGALDRLAADPHAGPDGERENARPDRDGADRSRGGEAGSRRLRDAGALHRSVSPAARRRRRARRRAAGHDRGGPGAERLRLASLPGHARDPAPDEQRTAREDEAERLLDQHGPGRRGGRDRAGRGAAEGLDRGGRTRRVRAGAASSARAGRHGERGAAASSRQRHRGDPGGDGAARAGKSPTLLFRVSPARSRGVTQDSLHSYLVHELPASADPLAESAAVYATQVADFLYNQLLDVVQSRAPELAPLLGEGAEVCPAELETGTLQILGIWLQLLSVAEQNAAMRRRRQIEAERGYEALRGTMMQVVGAAAQAKVPADELAERLRSLRIRPVLTAHPTEAKRVTVLEKHRRIYRLLVELESPRWTPRERAQLQQQVRNEIEILWMTGELRLEKPTVEQEVLWALHFFNETLFESVPQAHEKLERALAQHYPDHEFEVPAFFQFGSWVGGDRDGNPFVTNDVTRRSLLEYRLAALRRYRQRLGELIRRLSISERAIRIPDDFRRYLDRLLAASGDAAGIAARNPGEIFRQFLACVLRRLDLTLAPAERHEVGPDEGGYLTADELVADLRALERGVAVAVEPSLAQALVEPVRREVELFRFSTVRLDIRENTTKLNEALCALWRLRGRGPADGVPDPQSPEWARWVQAELTRPRHEELRLSGLPAAAA